MPDREKVIKGLECCTQHGSMCGRDCNGHWCWTDGSHTGMKLLGEYRTKCSYGNCETGCVKTLTKDALALLKAQEPRVMTFDEIVSAAPGTVVWLEDYDKTDVIVGLVKKVYIYTKVIDFLIVNEKVNDEITADLDAYNEGWRCWTSRPTDEQREAESWN